MPHTLFHSATTTLRAGVSACAMALCLAVSVRAGDEDPSGNPSTEPAARPVESPVKAREARESELRARTGELARRMDGLSAETQDLIWNHTDPRLTSFLKAIDDAMLDARDLLEAENTGGPTVAAQQDVLEKVYEAAKKAAENSRSGGQPKDPGEKPENGQSEGQGEKGESGGDPSGQGEPKDGSGQQPDGNDAPDGVAAMLRMMEQMLGITPTEQPGKEGAKQGQGGSQPGEGQTAPGSGAPGAAGGASGRLPMVEERTVPRAAGSTPGSVPPEYRESIEAYRKALDSLQSSPPAP